MKQTILLFLLLPIICLAQKIDYTFKTTKDNDNVNSNSQTIIISNNEFGIGISKSQYQTNSYNKDATGILLATNYEKNNFSLVGNLGIGYTSNKKYLLGDITSTIKINDFVAVNATIFGDIVDSNNALSNNITAKGIILGKDISIDKIGIAFGSKHIWYDDNNHQTGYFLKSFYTISEGVNVYLTKKHYTNSLPNSRYYFSPNMYDRSGVGMSIRKRFDSVIIYGFFERTKIKTQFDNEYANSWKLEIKTPVYDKIKIKLSFGKDFNNGFYYRYIESNLNYEF